MRPTRAGYGLEAGSRPQCQGAVNIETHGSGGYRSPASSTARITMLYVPWSTSGPQLRGLPYVPSWLSCRALAALRRIRLGARSARSTPTNRYSPLPTRASMPSALLYREPSGKHPGGKPGRGVRQRRLADLLPLEDRFPDTRAAARGQLILVEKPSLDRVRSGSEPARRPGRGRPARDQPTGHRQADTGDYH
jgi:hypothetical protein